jgi:hypothetical protein
MAKQQQERPRRILTRMALKDKAHSAAEQVAGNRF